MAPPDWKMTVKGQRAIFTHPDSGMDFSSLPDDFFEVATPLTQAIEMMWLFGAANLNQTGNEIIVPRNIVETHGSTVLSSLSDRLQALLHAPTATIYDSLIDCFRITPDRTDPLMPVNTLVHRLLSRVVHSAVEDGVDVPVQPAHIPRPPNSFILYRQHHHHAVTAANPGVQNTQISRLIANMWRKETPEVRACFKELADKKKEIHAQVNPGYQYSPRRPGARLRRRRARVATGLVPFIGATQAGLNRINQANSESRGMIDVDGDFLDLLDHHGVLTGPNGVAPATGPQNLDFEAIVEQQFGHAAMDTVRFPPLQGNEFDDNFPMAAMLELDGA